MLCGITGRISPWQQVRRGSSIRLRYFSEDKGTAANRQRRSEGRELEEAKARDCYSGKQLPRECSSHQAKKIYAARFFSAGAANAARKIAVENTATGGLSRDFNWAFRLFDSCRPLLSSDRSRREIVPWIFCPTYGSAGRFLFIARNRSIIPPSSHGRQTSLYVV